MIGRLGSQHKLVRLRALIRSSAYASGAPLGVIITRRFGGPLWVRSAGSPSRVGLPRFGRYPTPVPRPHIRGLRTNQTIRHLLLEAMRRPSRDPPHGEGWGEEFFGQTKPVQK